MVRTSLVPVRLVSSAALTLALAACNAAGPSSPAASASAVPGATPTTFRMPAGSGCAGDIARFQAVIDNDVQVGHLNQSVYNRMNGELGRVSAACAAGREAEAEAQLRATRSRFGYP